MVRIEKFKSGFYGLYNGDVLRDASLVKWDGKKGTFYPYDTKAENEYCEYFISASGDIYFSVAGGSSGLWCPASDLNKHCHHLAQIRARR